MTALTTEEFTTWANRLTGLPWPMTTEEFATIATGEFGWTIFGGEQAGHHLPELFRTRFCWKDERRGSSKDPFSVS